MCKSGAIVEYILQQSTSIVVNFQTTSERPQLKNKRKFDGEARIPIFGSAIFI